MARILAFGTVGLLFVSLTPAAWGQAAPQATPSGGAAAAADAAVGAATGGSSGGGANVTVNCGGKKSCLSGLGDMCKGCKAALCNSALGALLSNMVKPISFATGGVVPVPCQNVKDGSSGGGSGDSGGTGSGGSGGAGGQDGGAPSAKQTAAAIKKDQKDAKARLAAVQYLATVDCTYYPEVQAALVGSLRTDTSECVRLAAANALGRPCCCGKKSIEALRIAASGGDEDGNPAEPSCRVRAAARQALQICLACVPEADRQPDPTLRKPEEPLDLPDVFSPESPNPFQSESPVHSTGYWAPFRDGPGRPIRPVAYYESVGERPMAQVVAEARRTVERVDALEEAPPPHATTGHRNLADLWRAARRTRGAQ